MSIHYYNKREQKVIARNTKVLTIFCPEIFDEKSSFSIVFFLSEISEKLKNI